MQQKQQQIKYREPKVMEHTFTSFIRKSLGIQNQSFEKPSIKINRAFDSIGNDVETIEGLSRAFKYCKTNCAVTAGDFLEFVIQASNSGQGDLEYALDVDYKNVISWQKSNKLNVRILDEYVSKFCQIRIKVRDASRKWENICDDNMVIFSYHVRTNNLKSNPFSRFH